MAKLSGNDPRFVNINDDTSPVQLGRLSEKIYANDWFKAYESLNKTEESEFKILECLSNIVQVSGYHLFAFILFFLSSTHL